MNNRLKVRLDCAETALRMGLLRSRLVESFECGEDILSAAAIDLDKAREEFENLSKEYARELSGSDDEELIDKVIDCASDICVCYNDHAIADDTCRLSLAIEAYLPEEMNKELTDKERLKNALKKVLKELERKVDSEGRIVSIHYQMHQDSEGNWVKDEYDSEGYVIYE